MKDGPMKFNVHLCYEDTGGLLPPCPLSVWWILHFSPKHHPISFKLVSQSAFFPCYNSNILILVISQMNYQ